ncbi:MAG: OmpA family protein [Balneolaceae bacterium]
MNNIFKYILLLSLFFTATGKVYAQDGVPPHNTQIINIADGSYESSKGSGTVQSNPVFINIDNSVKLELYPEYVIKDYRGKTVQFTHYLKNTSTITDTYEIEIYNIEGADFKLQNLEIISENKLKALSSDTAKTQVTLAPGQIFEFKYKGDISTDEFTRITARVGIKAVSLTSATSLKVIDIISILNGTEIELNKSFEDGAQFVRGEPFNYVLEGKNTGDVTAYGTDITVDGMAETKVILKDKIPANTTFESFISAANGLPVYHIFGDNTHEYTTQKPSQLASIDEIAVLYDSVEVGKSFKTIFSVRINEAASDSINNIAEVTYVDPDGNVTKAAASQEVVATLTEGDARINYFTDGGFGQKTSTSTIGRPLFLQADAGACNENAAAIETATIIITSTLTSDKETFSVTETGRNTGVFRVDKPIPTRNANNFPPVSGNLILEVLPKDKLVAVLDCQNSKTENATITTEIVLDPFGVVFDSESNNPVKNATVRLIDVTGQGNGGDVGGLAKVYEADGVTEIDNEQVTDASGEFRFPFIFPSTYRLDVITPNGYEAPSQVNKALLDPSRTINDSLSYGRSFLITGSPTAIEYDVPVDPNGTNVLFTKKKVNKTTVEIGDYLTYTISISSKAVNDIDSTKIEDHLPFGFKYQVGSARLDGKPMSEPVGGTGPILVFNIGTLPPLQTVDLTYKVYVGPGSERGDGINTAISSSEEGIIHRQSLPAKVKVEVRGGVFSTDGYIIGKVFADCDENGIQDPGEKGVPGIRLYLENGSYVVTDAYGRYTIYGVTPNKHVIKLDNTTLPKGSRLSVLDNRHANDPSSRFVDLRNGEMQRADFAVCNCEVGGVHEEIDRRIAAYSKNNNELESSLNQNFATEEQKASKQGGYGEISGVVGSANTVDLGKKSSANSTKVTTDKKVQETEVIEEIDYLLEAVSTGNNDLEILNVADGDTLLSTSLRLQVKSAASATVYLFVNDDLIGVDNVGRTEINEESGVQGLEFFNLSLKSGKNVLTLQSKDPFGNVREEEIITVYAPGKPKYIQIYLPQNNIEADGESTAYIQIELTDEDGILIGDDYQITLDISEGKWLLEDENEKEQGTQVTLKQGIGEFALAVPATPRSEKIVAKLGTISSEVYLNFVPNLRPLIAAGIIEGTIRLSEPLAIASASSSDGFERELTALSRDFDNFTLDGRFAFFLKGKVAGSTLLTASYDSEKSEEDRLFRDIRPDEFYPVYGESSLKGFDAQSSGRLYIRLDRNRTYAVYGDFITQDRNQDRQLGDYSRAQTGIKTHYENDVISATAFGSEAFSSRLVREFAGEGISRYELPDNNIVLNSEIIELLVYDRNQPDVLLSSNRLERFRDYAIEPFTGTLVFTHPVASVDLNFNPVVVRATYEVENGGDKYLIGGADISVRPLDGLQIGAGVVQDQNPDDNFNLTSINAGYDIGNSTKIILEGAQTITDSKGTGQAGRVEIQHRNRAGNVRLQVGRSNKDFANRSTTLSSGKTEAKARGRLNLGNSSSLNTEALYSRNDTTGNETVGGLMTLQKTFVGNISTEVGVRYSRQETDSGLPTSSVIENTNFRGKLSADMPFVDGMATFVEYEQDMNNADKRLIALGGDYKVRSFAKVYARHEFSSSAEGRYTLNENVRKQNSVFGIKSSYMKNGEVYSEYQINEAIDGPTGQASIGLRNNFQIKNGFNVNAGFERIFTVKGMRGRDGTAISTSMDYTANPNWKATARAEARFTSADRTYVNSIGYGQRITDSWTFLGKNIIALSQKTNADGFNKVQERLRIGAAYRDIERNRWDALFRYEFKYENDKNISADYNRTAHVFSNHANYHPSNPWVFSSRIAAKYSVENDTDFKEESTLGLVSGRALYDINEKWDAGINASLLTNSDFTTKDYGLGLEVGFIAARNLRIATGFNFMGYDDEDLAANSYTRKGVYLGFSYKFDERLFEQLAPTKQKPFLDPNLYLTCEAIEICEPSVLDFDFDRNWFVASLQPAQLEAIDFIYKELELQTLLPKQIHFNNNSTYINRPAAQMLDKVAKFLFERDDYIIDVTGHTDSKSSYAYNLDLSERRAKAVRAYLVASGVDPDKLVFEGMSFSKKTDESDPIDMAMNRRVELNMNTENMNVRFVDQIEDLQVNMKIPAVGGWDFIYNPEHKAVPANINLTSGFNKLSPINSYMIERVGIALAEFVEVDITVSIAESAEFENIKELMEAELIFNGISVDRISFAKSSGSNPFVVELSYSKPQLLEIIAQSDDVKFKGNKKALGMMQNMLATLKGRDDYSLLRDFSQTYVVPDRIFYDSKTSLLSNENQAILSRVGSYLRDNQVAFLELTSNGSALGTKRVKAITDYLVAWGIEEGRISINEHSTHDDNERVMFKYLKADSINLLDIDILYRGGK